jgi:imidazolonepropionase
MPAVMSLACREMNLSAEEAIGAATINAAAAMDAADRLGSIEPGKQADLALFDVQDYREIPYYFGFNLCVMTMKKGRVIYRAPSWQAE